MDSPPFKWRCPPYGPAHFPEELLPGVLSFCTVKTLKRFSCISKFTNSLLSDTTFINLHRERSSRNPHLALLPTELESGANSTFVPFPVRSLLGNQSFVVPFDDPNYQLKEKDCRWVVGSCNGLLCLLGYAPAANARVVWFRIWNPATGKLSERLGLFLDSDMGLYTKFKFAFGYDESTSTYKIVALLGKTVVKVFCLGEKLSEWRVIEDFPVLPRNHVFPYHYTNPGLNDAVYLRSTLNWIAIDNRFWKNSVAEQYVIVSLDLCTETYTLFPAPWGFLQTAPVDPAISVLMEKLCYFQDFRRIEIVIWQMEEFGVARTWDPLIRISYQSLQSIDHDSVDLAYFQWLPLHLSESGGTLILANNQEKQAIIYNVKDKTVQRTTNANAIDWFSARDYVESLVPVPSGV